MKAPVLPFIIAIAAWCGGMIMGIIWASTKLLGARPDLTPFAGWMAIVLVAIGVVSFCVGVCLSIWRLSR